MSLLLRNALIAFYSSTVVCPDSVPIYLPPSKKLKQLLLLCFNYGIILLVYIFQFYHNLILNFNILDLFKPILESEENRKQ